MATQRHRQDGATREESTGEPIGASVGASRAQVRANRRNAKRSTGPKTDNGKRASSRNAVTHGVYCHDLVLPGESLAGFLALRLALHGDLRATDGVEFAIVERAAIAQWRLRRGQSAEAFAHEMRAERMAATARRQLARVQKKLDDLCDGEDEEYQAEQRARLQPKIDMWGRVRAADVPAAVTAAADFGEPSSALERLSRHEQRLERGFYTALRELRAYRKETREHGQERPEHKRPYADLAQMREELLAAAAAEAAAAREEEEAEDEDDQEEGEADGEDQEEGEGRERGQGTTDAADANEPLGGVASAALTSTAPAAAQNEPNPAETAAGDGADGGCAQGSRTIEVVTPTRLMPGGADRAARDEREGADRA